MVDVGTAICDRRHDDPRGDSASPVLDLVPDPSARSSGAGGALEEQHPDPTHGHAAAAACLDAVWGGEALETSAAATPA